MFGDVWVITLFVYNKVSGLPLSFSFSYNVDIVLFHPNMLQKLLYSILFMLVMKVNFLSFTYNIVRMIAYHPFRTTTKSNVN